GPAPPERSERSTGTDNAAEPAFARTAAAPASSRSPAPAAALQPAAAPLASAAAPDRAHAAGSAAGSPGQPPQPPQPAQPQPAAARPASGAEAAAHGAAAGAATSAIGGAQAARTAAAKPAADNGGARAAEPIPAPLRRVENPYEQALNELESRTVHRATWARAIAEGDGDAEKTKARYIRLRAEALIRSSGSDTRQSA
ncbi:MAG TPA: hypothetical protein VM491_00105, partial [Burkholderiaceae bacterium]|nr:hypothetical protein [Burkholderiaceae bacterium]